MPVPSTDSAKTGSPKKDDQTSFHENKINNNHSRPIKSEYMNNSNLNNENVALDGSQLCENSLHIKSNETDKLQILVAEIEEIIKLSKSKTGDDFVF